MKQKFDTTKFYYGFPIYILGYKDDQFGYNITTSSSSYSLGDMLVMGMFKGSNAVEQIQRYQSFTLNIPTEEQAFVMERAGFLTRRDKLSLLDVAYSMAEHIDAPLLDDCPVSLECVVESVQEFDNYVNFTARIVNRWVDNRLLDEKGHFQSESFHPLEYMGDGKARIYRYLDEEKSEKLGQFSKKGRKKHDKHSRTN